MKKSTLLAGLLTFSSLVFASHPDISGNYYFKGNDPFAKVDYEATMVITKTGDTYQFDWDLGKEYGKYKGTGFYVKGIDNYIPVTLVSLNKEPEADNPYNSELQVYKINKDGSLTGAWTFLGKSKLSPVEVCHKVVSKK